MRQKILLSILLSLIIGYFAAPFLPQNSSLLRIAALLRFTTSTSLNGSTSLEGPSGESAQMIDVRTLPDMLYEPYRLRVDKRFLLAIDGVTQIVTGKTKGPAQAAFHDGKWLIRHGDKDVGTVPERPDFSDMLILLAKWARSEASTNSFVVTSSKTNSVAKKASDLLDGFLAEKSSSALQLIDHEWRSGLHHVEFLDLAARGLINLTIQQLDKIEIGDQLPAKALAALAVARHYKEDSLIQEEVLLSYAMGYSAHARRLAMPLDTTDPVKLFALHEDHTLLATADQVSATRQARYLWLLRQHGCGCGDLKTYFSWLNKHFQHDVYSLPIVKTALDLNDFSLGPRLSETLPALVLFTLARNVDMPGLPNALKRFDSRTYSEKDLNTIVTAVEAMLTSTREVLLDRFESGLTVLDHDYSGPFLDARTYGAFYSGYFFSGLYTLGMHYLDKLSSESAVSGFITSLGAPSSGRAKDFGSWYRHLAALHHINGDAASVVRDIHEMQYIGAPPLIRSYNEIKDRKWAATPGNTVSIKAMMAHLDSRPEHRYQLAQMAYSDLLDMNLADAAYSSVVETDPAHFDDLHAWYLYFSGADRQLVALMESPVFSDKAKLMTLTLLPKSDIVPSTFISSHYEQLLKRQPGNWNVASAYIKFLQETKQYAKARSVASQWLGQKVTNGGLAPVIAKADVAWAYYHEGRYKEAWDTIRTVINSWQGTVLYRASLILDKLNRPTEAERMGQALIDRYPIGAKGRGMLAQLYWKHDKPHEAAEALKNSPVAITLYEWETEIGPVFEEAFEGRSMEQVQKALAALQQVGIDEYSLQRMSSAPARHGKHELAYVLLSQLRTNPSFFLYAYTHQKAWKGKEEALATLRSHIAIAQFGPASNVMYDDGQYDLLWDFSDQIDLQNLGDYVWLLRAAAYLEPNMRDDKQHQALITYYSEHKEGHYNMVGRYLIGLITQDELLAQAVSPSTIASTAYYLGVKAKSEGRYVDASDWFRYGTEFGSSREPEHKWCRDALSKWRLLGHNLDYIAAAQL